MSGLSYFDNGGQAGGDQTQVMVKPTAGRGRYGLPTPATNIPASSGVLSAMEQVYMDKLAQQQGFMEGMKDAAAWWSGGIEGPSAGLARRGKEREEQAANLFQLQTQIAQHRAAQEAQRAFEQRRQRELGAGGAQQTAPGARQPMAAEMFGMPAEIRQALANAKTESEYDKIFSDWAKKKAEVEASPEFDVPKIPVVTWNEETKEWQRDVISARQLRANPNKYLSPDAVPSAAPAPRAEAAPAAAPATMPAPAPAVAPAPSTAPVAAGEQKAKPVNYTFSELSPDQINAMRQTGRAMGLTQDVVDRPDAAELFDKQPLEKRKAVFDRLSQGTAQLASAPTTTATDVTAPTVGTMRPTTQLAQAPSVPAATAARPPRPTASQLERQAEIDKQVEIAAQQERLKSDKIERDKFVNEADPTKISERKVRAERVQQLVLEDPTIVGVLTQPNVKSAIANVIQQGLSTPSGAISVQGLSEAIFQTLPTTMNLNKRREIAGYIAQMELDAAQVMNGQGQISDSERQILRAAAISIEDPAEVVYKKAKMMQARQETLQKLKEVYGDGSQFTRNFQAFKNDPRYQQISREYEERIRQIAKEDVKIDRSMVGKVPGKQQGQQPKSKAPSPYSDPGKEQRYQEWKRSQGK